MLVANSEDSSKTTLHRGGTNKAFSKVTSSDFSQISIHAKYPFCLWDSCASYSPHLSKPSYASRNQICSVPSSSRRPDLADRNSRILPLISQRTLLLPPTPNLLCKAVRLLPGLHCAFAVKCASAQGESAASYNRQSLGSSTNASRRCTLEQRTRRKEKKRKKKERYSAD